MHLDLALKWPSSGLVSHQLEVGSLHPRTLASKFCGSSLKCSGNPGGNPAFSLSAVWDAAVAWSPSINQGCREGRYYDVSWRPIPGMDEYRRRFVLLVSPNIWSRKVVNKLSHSFPSLPVYAPLWPVKVTSPDSLSRLSKAGAFWNFQVNISHCTLSSFRMYCSDSVGNTPEMWMTSFAVFAAKMASAVEPRCKKTAQVYPMACVPDMNVAVGQSLLQHTWHPYELLAGSRSSPFG